MNTNKIANVLHFSPFPFDLSGANRSMLALIEESQLHSNVSLFTLCKGSLSNYSEKKKITTYYLLNNWPKFRLFRAPIVILYLFYIVLIKKINIVHCHSAIGNHYVKFLKLLNMRIVTHQRDNYKNDYFHSDLDYADCIVAISHHVRSTLPDNFKRKTVVQHNCVFINSSGLNVDNCGVNKVITIGMAGRCNPDKGNLYFLKSLVALIPKYDIKLIMWGVEGVYSFVLHDYLSTLPVNITSKITFEKFRADIDNFYNSVDIVVVPSLFEEPLGRIPLEAMSHFKPVLVSNRGGLKELMFWNQDLIFDIDNEESLRTKIIPLIKSRTLRKKIGNGGFTHLIENHNSHDYYISINKIYTKLLEEVDKDE